MQEADQRYRERMSALWISSDGSGCEGSKAEASQAQKATTIGCLSIIGFIVLCIILSLSSKSPDHKSASTSQPAIPSPPREAVENSAWDGSVYQVEDWLKENLKDPDSLKFSDWSPVAKTKSGGFMVRVKYRAKKSFGGHVVENKVFILDSVGNVVSSSDFPG